MLYTCSIKNKVSLPILTQQWCKNLFATIQFSSSINIRIKTDEKDPSFVSIAQKSSSLHNIHKISQHSKPDTYLFRKYNFTSPFTMTNLYTFEYSKISRYLRNCDHIKQYICLLPHNDISRPLKIFQKYRIHFDDFLLPCNFPTQLVKPLTIIEHLVSSPLDDKPISYCTALSKQAHSYNNFLSISTKVIFFMVLTEKKSKHKPAEHTSPIRTQTNSDKISSVSTNRTFRDITQR